MLFLWILLGLVLLFVVVPVVVGLFLGDDFHGQVRVVFDRPQEQVWAALQDFARHPLSGSMCREASALEDHEQQPAWLEDLGKTQLVVCTEQLEAPDLLVRTAADQVVPMTARWEFRLSEDGEGGTELLLSNHTVIRSGTWHSPIFRVIMRSSGGAEKVLREYLRGVAGDLGVTARLLDPAGA